MKKVLKKTCLVAIVAILTTMLPTQVMAEVTEDPFPDVAMDHENAVAIQYMKDNLVFQGYDDGTYMPDRVLNRAEQLKVYMVVHNINPDPAVYKDCFDDVGEEWFAPYVCYAKAQGWVVGYEDGTFKPAQEVNKVEALKMLGEIQGWAMSEDNEAPYDDTPADQWYIKYLAFAKDAGLLMEDGDNFEPGSGLSRAATAEVLFRSLAVYALGYDEYTPDVEEEVLAIVVADLEPPTPVQMAGDPVEAEYGDAPETDIAGYAGSYSTVLARFPTLYNTLNSTFGPGAHAMDSSMEYLGDPAQDGGYSYELDADDLDDPDGTENLDNEDGFDDGVRGLTVVLDGIPPSGYVTADVTVAPDAPDVPRYMNVVIDLNMDGRWKGKTAFGNPEWVVKNEVVNVAPGTTETITTESFAYSNGFILTPTTWMRVVLSRSPIDAAEYGADGWDGSGSFEFGEVEDYYVQLPDWDDGSGGSGGGPGGPGVGGRGLVWGKPAPVMVCPSKVTFPEGVNLVSFRCMIANLGGAGDTQYDLWWISGGVNVVPVTGIVPMPTAPPGFPPFGVVGNPTFVRYWAAKGSTPSTWGYRIVGIDPPSTVEDGNINLGIVPTDKDEGFGADEGFITDHWASEMTDYYLFDDGAVSPVIYDATFYEMDMTDAPGTHKYTVVAHAADPNGDDLSYTWSSPYDCGTFVTEGDELIWTFDDSDEMLCKVGGLELTVSDGTNSDTATFDDVFPDAELPTNEAPTIEWINSIWMNSMEDDPHIYELTVYADDPEGGALTYSWASITCGEFVGSTTNQTVQWHYALADMEECGAAEVTVNVTDDMSETTTLTQAIFE